MSANVNTELDDGILTARLRGEIDLATADEVAAAIRAAVPNAALGVIVDLGEVTYLDSSGVRLLFELSDRLRRRQQKLRVVAPAEASLRRVLDLVDLGATVPLLETTDAAAEDMRRGD